jgi:hypothetical protein
MINLYRQENFGLVLRGDNNMGRTILEALGFSMTYNTNINMINVNAWVRNSIIDKEFKA